MATLLAYNFKRFLVTTLGITYDTLHRLQKIANNLSIGCKPEFTSQNDKKYF
jgi:hypothetical protein